MIGKSGRKHCFERASTVTMLINRSKNLRSWTYFATDMAYHLDKYKRGFSYMINVWGADRGLCQADASGRECTYRGTRHT